MSVLTPPGLWRLVGRPSRRTQGHEAGDLGRTRVTRARMQVSECARTLAIRTPGAGGQVGQMLLGGGLEDTQVFPRWASKGGHAVVRGMQGHAVPAVPACVGVAGPAYRHGRGQPRGQRALLSTRPASPRADDRSGRARLLPGWRPERLRAVSPPPHRRAGVWGGPGRSGGDEAPAIPPSLHPAETPFLLERRSFVGFLFSRFFVICLRFAFPSGHLEAERPQLRTKHASSQQAEGKERPRSAPEGPLGVHFGASFTPTCSPAAGV